MYKNQDLSGLLLTGLRCITIFPPITWGIETGYTNSNQVQSKSIGFYWLFLPFLSWGIYIKVAGNDDGILMTGYRCFLNLPHFLTLLMFPLIDMLIISGSSSKEHNFTFHTVQWSQVNGGTLLRKNNAGNDRDWETMWCLSEDLNEICVETEKHL